jgi:hypothetical protein
VLRKGIVCGGLIAGYLMTLCPFKLLFNIVWSAKLALFAELGWTGEEAV